MVLKPQIKIAGVLRDMTDDEFAQYELDQAAAAAAVAAAQVEIEAKAVQKAALLERLGITEEEARLLLQQKVRGKWYKGMSQPQGYLPRI